MRYRFSQFWRHFKARPLSPKSIQEVHLILDDRQFGLYDLLTAQDQSHSYLVMKKLSEKGEVNEDVLIAALLHDVGKTQAPISVWERSLAVLIEKLKPGTAERFGEGAPSGWRRAFVVKTQHPIWGAEMARSSGCSELSVSLIARHQEFPVQNEECEESRLLKSLQWADNSS